MTHTDSYINITQQASENAYAPYSKFKVGALLVSKSGNYYVGCNVENISFGLTNCAERTAIFNAIAAGERDFYKLFVYADTKSPISPCGACRQVMAEFFDADVEIYLVNNKRQVKQLSIAELLPYQFKSLS